MLEFLRTLYSGFLTLTLMVIVGGGVAFVSFLGYAVVQELPAPFPAVIYITLFIIVVCYLLGSRNRNGTNL